MTNQQSATSQVTDALATPAQITAVNTDANVTHPFVSRVNVPAQPVPVLPGVPVQNDEREIRWRRKGSRRRQRRNLLLLTALLVVICGIGWAHWQLGATARLQGVIVQMVADLSENSVVARLRPEEGLIIQLTRNPIQLATGGPAPTATPPPAAPQPALIGLMSNQQVRQEQAAYQPAALEPTAPEPIAPKPTTAAVALLPTPARLLIEATSTYPTPTPVTPVLSPAATIAAESIALSIDPFGLLRETLAPGKIVVNGTASPGLDFQLLVDGVLHLQSQAKDTGTWSTIIPLEHTGEHELLLRALHTDGSTLASISLPLLINAGPRDTVVRALGVAQNTSTVTPTPTALLTATPKFIPTLPAPLPVAMAFITATVGSTSTVVASLTATPTASVTGTSTPTPTPTLLPSATVTASHTPTAVSTATATALPSATATPTTMPSSTPSSTPTATATYTPTPTASATPTSTSTATPTATSTATASPTATATATSTATPLPASASVADGMTLVLASDPPQMVAAGGEITYTIHYTNHSLAPIAELTVAGVVPAGMVLVAESVPPTALLVPQGNKQTIVWSVGDLAAQSGGTVSYRVQQPVLTTPQLAAAVALHVRGPLTATAGTSITYTLQITNPRPFPLRNLVVVNELPATATLISAGGGEFVDNEVRWTLPQLAGASTTTLQWSVSATQSLANVGAWVRVDGGPVVVGNTVITTIDGEIPAAALTAIHNEGAQISWRANDAQYRLRSGPLDHWVMP